MVGESTERGLAATEPVQWRHIDVSQACIARSADDDVGQRIIDGAGMPDERSQPDAHPRRLYASSAEAHPLQWFHLAILTVT